MVDRTYLTKLEVNLDALIHNARFYKGELLPSTKMMVMIKATGYGSGDVPVAKMLQESGLVEYLGVAYCDEGVVLRKAGIELPMMVMNPTEEDFQHLLLYNLEPAIYSVALLKAYIDFSNRSTKNLPGVHIKVDTGMHRLGIHLEEADQFVHLLKQNSLGVKGVYTHFAATPEHNHDDFTNEQAKHLTDCYNKLCSALEYKPLLHATNSAGIIRFPEYQFDMVRLGMGLYGLDPSDKIQEELMLVSRFTTTISQIHVLQKGDTVGYDRKCKIESNNHRIGILAAGYADGYKRIFSNGNAEVFVNGYRAPVVGNVCMDMTFIDVTDIPCEAGDEVELFGANIGVRELAERAGTIDYEILTSIGARVNRIYLKN